MAGNGQSSDIPPSGPIAPSDGVQVPFSEDALLKIWEKAVDTQMHFNEMSAKSRQLGLTFVAASLGVAAFMLSNSKDFYFHIPLKLIEIHAHASGLIFVAAALGVIAVRTLDVNVYHKMLRGAVVFGEDFESRFITPKLGLNKGMTQAISHFSRFSDAHTHDGTSPYQYCGIQRTTAGDKVKTFYRYTAGFLIFAAIVTLLIMHFNYSPSGPGSAKEQTSKTAPT